MMYQCVCMCSSLTPCRMVMGKSGVKDQSNSAMLALAGSSLPHANPGERTHANPNRHELITLLPNPQITVERKVCAHIGRICTHGRSNRNTTSISILKVGNRFINTCCKFTFEHRRTLVIYTMHDADTQSTGATRKAARKRW